MNPLLAYISFACAIVASICTVKGEGGYSPQSRRTPPRRRWRWKKKIEFPNFSLKTDGKGAALEHDAERGGCYRVKGDIKIHQRLRNNLQFFVTINTKIDRAPVPCIGYDRKTGCGGLGSCLYCQSCEQVGSKKKQEVLARARLERNGRPLRCGERLSPGTHKDVALHFCLPSKKEFLKLYGIDEDLFKRLIKIGVGDGTDEESRRSVFITVYLFERKVNARLQRTYLLERLLRAQEGMEENERLRLSAWNNLPFYHQVVIEGRGFVGCHRLYGNVTMT